MDAAGADGFAEAIVGVVLMVRKDLHPPVDQARGHRLGADVHQPPLIQEVIVEVYLACLNGIEQILAPGDKQPHDGAAFLGDGPEDPFRLHAPQQNGLAPGKEGAEPVHLGAGVVQRRDAQEHILAGLPMVVLLRFAGGEQGTVVVQDRLREAGGAGGKIDRGIVRLRKRHRRRAGGAEAHEPHAVLRIARAVRAHEEHHAHQGQIAGDGVHPAHEFRPEHQHFHIRELQAVFDLIAGITEIHRHGDAAGLQDSKVNGQPLQAVHHQNAHLCLPLHTAAQQQVGETVGTAVKIRPGHLPAVRRVGLRAFNELRFAPGNSPVPFFRRVDLNEADLTPVEPGISFQQFRDYHCFLLLLFLYTDKKSPLQNAEDELTRGTTSICCQRQPQQDTDISPRCNGRSRHCLLHSSACRSERYSAKARPLPRTARQLSWDAFSRLLGFFNAFE